MNSIDQIEKEAELAFNLIYLPISISKGRTNGADFLSACKTIMKELDRNNAKQNQKSIFAHILVKKFNERGKFDLDKNELKDMEDLISGKSNNIFF